jgi:DNA-directed RNA polymerase subunit beta'
MELLSYGVIVKRGNREINIESKDGTRKKYLVPSVETHILVQDGDYVKAGEPLSDGAITPSDILSIKGPTAVQEYLVNEIQEVYRLQGVKINDKHIECIVRQMMQKVEIMDPGDTNFLEMQPVDKWTFREENDRVLDMKVVEDAGDSETLKPGMLISARRLRDENSTLKRRDQRLVVARDAKPAVAQPTLMGITQASLGTESFILSRLVPRSDQGIERSSSTRKTRYPRRFEGKCDCRSLDSSRYGCSSFPKTYCWLKRRTRNCDRST